MEAGRLAELFAKAAAGFTAPTLLLLLGGLSYYWGIWLPRSRQQHPPGSW